MTGPKKHALNFAGCVTLAPLLGLDLPYLLFLKSILIHFQISHTVMGEDMASKISAISKLQTNFIILLQN